MRYITLGFMALLSTVAGALRSDLDDGRRHQGDGRAQPERHLPVAGRLRTGHVACPSVQHGPPLMG